MLEPDRPQCDRPAVFARQYFPVTFNPLRFHLWTDKFGALFKMFYFISFFLEVCIWHCVTRNSVTRGVNVLEGLNEVSVISRYIYSVLCYTIGDQRDVVFIHHLCLTWQCTAQVKFCFRNGLSVKRCMSGQEILYTAEGLWKCHVTADGILAARENLRKLWLCGYSDGEVCFSCSWLQHI